MSMSDLLTLTQADIYVQILHKIKGLKGSRPNVNV